MGVDVPAFSSLSRSLSLSTPVGTSTRWLGDVGETGDTFPGFGDRRPLTLYVGLKGARSELTEIEEFRFEAQGVTVVHRDPSAQGSFGPEGMRLTLRCGISTVLGQMVTGAVRKQQRSERKGVI
jgi:hypothetical protein